MLPELEELPPIKDLRESDTDATAREGSRIKKTRREDL